MAWSVIHVLPSWSIVSPWGIKNLDKKKHRIQEGTKACVREGGWGRGREGREQTSKAQRRFVGLWGQPVRMPTKNNSYLMIIKTSDIFFSSWFTQNLDHYKHLGEYVKGALNSNRKQLAFDSQIRHCSTGESSPSSFVHKHNHST